MPTENEYTLKYGDELEMRAYSHRYRMEIDSPHAYFHDRWAITKRGGVVLSFLERWGMVQGEDSSKEDSAGRAILTLMPPEEVVKRAFEIVDLAFAEMEKRNWLAQLPDMEKLGALAESMDKAAEAKKKAGEVKEHS